MRLLRSLTLILGLSASFASAASIFTFDGDTPGSFTTFTDTIGTLSATFWSPSDPGSFTVVPASANQFQSPMAGNVLEDPGPIGFGFLPLFISFNQMLNSVSLDFATDGTSPFVLTAFNNGAFVGQVVATGSVPSGGIFPQGTISFSGAFNSIVLADAHVPYFAIDNVAANVPEPATFALIGAGLLGLGGIKRLRSLRRR